MTTNREDKPASQPALSIETASLDRIRAAVLTAASLTEAVAEAASRLSPEAERLQALAQVAERAAGEALAAVEQALASARG